MSKLIANVWAAGQGWGPGYGNADQVPADVAAEIDDPAVWADGKLPDKEPGVQGNPDAGQSAAPDEPQEPAEAPQDADEPVTVQQHVLTELAAVPDDKDALIAFRDRFGLDVDGRLGVEKLRAALTAAIAPDDDSEPA